jgi:formate-dependent nitrite reductase cytochrome c552 subunit
MYHPKVRALLRDFIVKLGKTRRDNRRKLGAEPNMAKDCKDCDELDIATLQNANADLKTKVDALDGQVKDLTAKLADSDKKVKEATDALGTYKAAEGKALIESITQHSQLKADELKDRSVEDLRIIHMAIDKAKPAEGTVKNVRGADGSKSTRANVTADGKLDSGISIMGIPVRQADGSIKWEVH